MVSEHWFQISVLAMASMKFDLLLLDLKTRFSLWQVKMRAILSQASDLDEALDAFGKKDAKEWTPEEKRKDRKLYHQLNFIYLMISCKRCCMRNPRQRCGSSWNRSACPRI